jgi:hypothetical protein
MTGYLHDYLNNKLSSKDLIRKMLHLDVALTDSRVIEQYQKIIDREKQKLNRYCSLTPRERIKEGNTLKRLWVQSAKGYYLEGKKNAYKLAKLLGKLLVWQEEEFVEDKKMLLKVIEEAITENLRRREYYLYTKNKTATEYFDEEVCSCEMRIKSDLQRIEEMQKDIEKVQRKLEAIKRCNI